MNKDDLISIFEIARIALETSWDEVAHELDVSDEEMERLDALVKKVLNH